MTSLDSVLKSKDSTLLTKVHIVKDAVFQSSCMMWKLDHKEGWVTKNQCFLTVVLERTFESLLDCKEIKLVTTKGNQPWIFIGRTDAEAEVPILWPPDLKHRPIWKDLIAGKDWGQEKKGATELEMFGWHYQLNGHEFEQTLGDSERQGNLECCSPWGHKQLDMTEWLHNNKSLIVCNSSEK